MPVKLTVSHAPFIHIGSRVQSRNLHISLAALPALIPSIYYYGAAALSVLFLSVSSAMAWECLFRIVSRRDITITDGSAWVAGLLFGMLLPVGTPWWFVIAGTFISVVIAKEIFGGTGCNPFNPALIGLAILTVSWPDMLDFNEAVLAYETGFPMPFPLASLKHFGTASTEIFSAWDLLTGRQTGGTGSVFGLGLICGGLYLLIKGIIRWEITLSFIAGILVTALLFHVFKPDVHAGPVFHLLTGYSLIAAFFLATDDTSSPVGFSAMLIYGAGGGVLTMLIRNLGIYYDGAVFAVLFMNLSSPLLDRIR